MAADDELVFGLRALALQLLLVTALLHLLYAVPRLELYTPAAMAVYAERGIVPPPRPALFLLTGAAIVGGALAAWRGFLPLRTAYVLGIALSLTLVASWVVWHTVLEHGAVLTGTSTESTLPADHHSGVLDTVYSHYVEPLAAVVAQGASRPGLNTALLGVVAKTIELAAAAVLALLLRVDPAARRARDGDGLAEALFDAP